MVFVTLPTRRVRSWRSVVTEGLGTADRATMKVCRGALCAGTRQCRMRLTGCGPGGRRDGFGVGSTASDNRCSDAC
jgi:hypothetical protein